MVGAVIKSGSETISIDEDKRESAAHNCNVGAGIYAAFVGVSALCILLPARLCPPKKNDDDRASLMGEYRASRSTERAQL